MKMPSTFDQLGAKWGTLKKEVNLLKFGGGFYCGKVDGIYIINGFYMDMRKAFTTPGTSIYYYETEWPSSGLSWADFRGKVLGGTDPKSAAPGSLRNMIFKDWQSLRLKAVPNTGDNGVHASASPFEALAERSNWLGYRIDRDPFGKVLLKGGVPAPTIKDWSKDPQVTFGPIAMTRSLFDTLEDTDSDYCAAPCQMIAGASK